MEHADNLSPPAGKNDRAVQRSSLGEHVERVLEDLLGVLGRLSRTVVLFALRPRRAASHLVGGAPAGFLVVGPYTFLLLGCLLYSYVLGAASRLTESKFTAVIWTIVKRQTAEAVSLEPLLIRTLPLVVGTSLFAAAAGALFRARGKDVRRLFAYLYGLQGIAILLFALSMSALGAVLQRFIGSDDWIPLVFAILTVSLAIQGYRSLRHLTRPEDASTRRRHLLLSAAYPLLFLLPLPLIGYGVVTSGLIEQVREGPREPIVLPVRILDAEVHLLSSSGIRITAAAVVENRSKYNLAVRPEGVLVELYLVSRVDFRRTSFYGRDVTKRSIPSLESFDRYLVDNTEARLATTQGDSDVRTLAPGAATVIHVTASSDATSAIFFPKRESDHGSDALSERARRVLLPPLTRPGAEMWLPVVRIVVSDPTLPGQLGQLGSSFYEAAFAPDAVSR